MNPPGPAARAPQTWIDYWSHDEFWKNSPLWRINASLFFRRLAEVVEIRPTDSVLNIGCGPGHLERLLSPRVKDILAVDVSPQFVERCRENCRACPNVRVAALGGDYTDLSGCAGRFSLILAVSVVQYYRNLGEVETLIASARKVALPGAKLLLADLPRRRGPIGFTWDGLCSLAQAARRGYLPLLLRTAGARWGRRSDYTEFQNANRELSFTIKDLESLIVRIGLPARVVEKNLSIYANRPSLLIQF